MITRKPYEAWQINKEKSVLAKPSTGMDPFCQGVGIQMSWSRNRMV